MAHPGPSRSRFTNLPVTEPVMAFVFDLFELLFLFLSLILAFLTARQLKGGIFGRGMGLLAWGFLIMAIDHLHMQIDMHYGFNLFESLLGATGGSIAWGLALMLTWALSGIGLYQMYRASKGSHVAA